MTTNNQGLQGKKQDQNQNIGIESEQHDKSRRARALRQFSQQVYRKFHICLFFFLILVGIGYSVPLMTLNYVGSVGKDEINSLYQQQNNIISKTILRFSNLSIIYFSTTSLLTQTGVLIALMLILTVGSFIIENWAKQLAQSYTKSLPLIQSYSLQVSLKNKLKKKQVKEFLQYFQNFVSTCIQDKIFSASINPLSISQKNTELTLLREITNNLTLIHDAILLPQRVQAQGTYADIDARQEESNLLIIILSYSEIAENVLEWWQKEMNRNKVKTQILSIQKAGSPQDYLFKKMKNVESYRNKVQNRLKYLTVAILVEALYITVLSFLIYLHSQPSYMFNAEFISGYSVYLHYGLLVLGAVIMVLCVVLFHQKLVLGMLLKSTVQVITISKQLLVSSILSVCFLMTNLFIIPISAYVIVEFSNSYQGNNQSQVIQNCFFGQFGIGNLLLCYSLIKSIVLEPIVCLVGGIRNCKTKTNDNQIKPNFNQLASKFIETLIIFSYSVITNPLLSIVCLIGISLKFIRFFRSINDIEFTCFMNLTGYLVTQIKIISYFFIIMTCLINNGLLVGYAYAIGQSSQMYLLILSLSVPILMLLLSIILNKKLNLPIPSSLLDPFPTQQMKCISSSPLQKNPNQSEQKKIANKLIQRIFTNQKFLFTYDQELRQKSNFPNFGKHQAYQILRKQSTKKVIEQLNTMSRSLEETLKQRLMTSSTNPFQLIHPPVGEDDQFDEPYERKVHMKSSKPKTVRIPMLFLPDSHREKNQEKKLNINRKNTIENKQSNAKKKKNQTTVNASKTYQLYSKMDNSGVGMNKSGSDFQYDVIGKKQSNTKNHRNQAQYVTKSKKHNDGDVTDQLYAKKIKFTNLFDSDEESIKHKVKKKIKDSIQKIQY